MLYTTNFRQHFCCALPKYRLQKVAESRFKIGTHGLSHVWWALGKSVSS
jgi:hypothetical protein